MSAATTPISTVLVSAESALVQPKTAQPAAPPISDPEGPPEIVVHPLALSMRWIAVILSIGALFIAKSIILPLVTAFLLGCLFRPVVRALARRGFPPGVGALVVIALLGTSLGIGGVYLKGPFEDWVTKLPGAIQSVQWRVRDLASSFSPVAQATKAVESLADEHAAHAPTQVEIKGQSWSMWLLSSAQEVAVSMLMTLLALYFILAVGDRFLQRLISIIPDLRESSSENLLNGGQAGGSMAMLSEMEAMAFSYFSTITVLNLLLGASLAVATYFLGLSTPLLWGAMATTLNFLPYIGPLLGVVVLSLVSLVTFPDVPHAILPPLAYACLILVESNFITPWVLGRRLAMSPLAIFMWLIFMGWLWGIGGALIAVPTLIVIKIICDRMPTMRWVGLLIEA